MIRAFVCVWLIAYCFVLILLIFDLFTHRYCDKVLILKMRGRFWCAAFRLFGAQLDCANNNKYKRLTQIRRYFCSRFITQTRQSFDLALYVELCITIGNLLTLLLSNCHFKIKDVWDKNNYISDVRFKNNQASVIIHFMKHNFGFTSYERKTNPNVTLCNKKLSLERFLEVYKNCKFKYLSFCFSHIDFWEKLFLFIVLHCMWKTNLFEDL